MKKISIIAVALYVGIATTAAQAATSFLNVSYDPTREFYQEYNQAFGKSVSYTHLTLPTICSV